MATPVIVEDDEFAEERITLGIDEMDRVLGGGLTKGSSILLGGDPGIGKTTLSFAVAARLSDLGVTVLYVSGEESLKQLAGRKKRLGLKSPFSLLVTNRLDDIRRRSREGPTGCSSSTRSSRSIIPGLPSCRAARARSGT